jgi:hypothetical protein
MKRNERQQDKNQQKIEKKRSRKTSIYEKQNLMKTEDLVTCYRMEKLYNKTISFV